MRFYYLGFSMFESCVIRTNNIVVYDQGQEEDR